MYLQQRIKGNKSLQTITMILFLIYLLFLAYLLFFGYYRQSIRVESYNLTPFKTIKMYIQYSDHFHFKVWFSNLFGNILAFIPFGFLAPLISRKLRKIARTTIAAFFLSLMVESIQWIFHVGGFDVDDIMLNTIGGSIGFILLLISSQILAKKPAKPK